jgi:hypothetical protein
MSSFGALACNLLLLIKELISVQRHPTRGAPPEPAFTLFWPDDRIDASGIDRRLSTGKPTTDCRAVSLKLLRPEMLATEELERIPHNWLSRYVPRNTLAFGASNEDRGALGQRQPVFAEARETSRRLSPSWSGGPRPHAGSFFGRWPMSLSPMPTSLCRDHFALPAWLEDQVALVRGRSPARSVLFVELVASIGKPCGW